MTTDSELVARLELIGRNWNIYKSFIAIMADSCTHAHRGDSNK